MGIEADVRAFPEADRARLAEIITLYKAFRPLLHAGRTRLEAAEPGAVAFMVVGDTGALVSYAQLETRTLANPAPLRLAGLTPGVDYRIRLMTPARGAPLQTGTASGALLAQMGLPLPILRPGEIAVFHLETG
jgi:alpha-galactosidase